MILQLSFLLLPLASACGWFWGRRDMHVEDRKLDAKLRGVYFQGLNYLIDEKPDRAVDVFIHLVDIDGDTVETHLTLGNLFRRRGEFDRAIRIHQNLIARPQLSPEYRFLALFSLAQDYFFAGVLDRSERLLLDLIKCGSENKSILKLLLRIYEQERDWGKSIQISKRLQIVSSSSTCVVTGHYYCQLAEELIDQDHYVEANSYLKQAVSIDKNCVRAYLLWAQIERVSHCYEEAVRYYQKVESLNIEHVFLVLKEYCYCYSQLGREDEIQNLFARCVEYSPELYLSAVFDDAFVQFKPMLLAAKILLPALEKKNSFFAVECLLSDYIEGKDNQCEKKFLLALREKIRSALNNELVYQCQHCGFTSHPFLWSCPGCHQWSVFRVKSLMSEGGC